MCENETNTNTESKIMQTNTYPVDELPTVVSDGNHPGGAVIATAPNEPCLAKNEPVKSSVKQRDYREVSLILTFFEHISSRI